LKIKISTCQFECHFHCNSKAKVKAAKLSTGNVIKKKIVIFTNSILDQIKFRSSALLRTSHQPKLDHCELDVPSFQRHWQIWDMSVFFKSRRHS